MVFSPRRGNNPDRMGDGVFAVVFLAGAAALALWVETRWPSLAPTSLGRAAVHVAVAAVALVLVLPPGMDLVGAGGSEPARLTAIFAVALPILTYALLTSVWVLKVAQRVLSGAVR